MSFQWKPDGPKMGPGPAATAPTWDWRREKIVPNWCFDSVRSQSLKHTFFARCLLIAVLSLHLIPAHSISQDVSGNLASSQARQVRRCNSRGMFAVCGRVFPRQRLWVTNTDDDQMMTVAKWEMFLCLISASASAFTRVRLNILDGQRRIWTYTGVSYNFSIVMCSEQTITDTICILEQKNPPNCSSWCMIGKVHHLWLQYSQHLLHHSKVGSLQYNWLLVRMNIARKLIKKNFIQCFYCGNSTVRGQERMRHEEKGHMSKAADAFKASKFLVLPSSATFLDWNLSPYLSITPLRWEQEIMVTDVNSFTCASAGWTCCGLCINVTQTITRLHFAAAPPREASRRTIFKPYHQSLAFVCGFFSLSSRLISQCHLKYSRNEDEPHEVELQAILHNCCFFTFSILKSNLRKNNPETANRKWHMTGRNAGTLVWLINSQ